jgi:hypothetical protein
MCCAGEPSPHRQRLLSVSFRNRPHPDRQYSNVIERISVSILLICSLFNDVVSAWNFVFDIRGGTSRAFRDRVLKRIFGTKRCEVIGENYKMRRLITWTLRQVWLEWSSQGGWDWQGSSTNGRRGMHIGYWWERQKRLGRPRRGWVEITKWILET